MPQSRKPKTTAIDAASALSDVLPKVSWTRLAVEPVNVRWLIRRSANTFAFVRDGWKYAAIATSTAGRTDNDE